MMNIGSILAIVGYVLGALGLYTIAKRRGINNPWLAWVPVADMWVLGCISDQYRHIVKNQVKTKRKSMPILKGAMLALLFVIVVLGISMAIDVIPYLPEGLLSLETLTEMSFMSDSEMEAMLEDMVSQFSQPTPAVIQVLLVKGIVVALLGLTMSVVAVVLAVQMYMAYYDLFTAANPKNATLYLVLGLVGNMMNIPLVLPALVFSCRGLDDGMPVRQP